MTAIEAINHFMKVTGTSLNDLVERTDTGSKSNICHKLHGNDLKVSTFVELLEAMGCELVVQPEIGDDVPIDYDYF